MRLPSYPKYKDSGVPGLGDIPAHWSLTRLKHVAIVQTGIAKGKDNGDKETIEVPYLRVANVQDGYLKLEDVATIEISSDALARYRLQPGDVLMNEGGDFDKLGRGHVWEGQIEDCIHQNHVFAVRPISVDSEWLNRISGSDYAQFYFMVRSKQSTNLASISSTNLMELPLVIPPASEQKAILQFLNSEIGKIDFLIFEQETLITLLAEKRLATIAHSVTKGLNPNTPMKDSGVEWMNNVPEHWRVLGLERVTVDKCDGPFGSGIKSEHYTDEGALVVRLQNICADEFNRGTPVFVNYQYFVDKLQGHDVKEGDLLVAGLGDGNNLLGRACVAPKGIEPALVKADCFRFRLDTSQVLPTFAAAQFSAGARNDAGRLSSGSTRSRIPLGTMATRKVALPPLTEQSAIVDFLHYEIGRIDILTHEATRGIALLKERRSALISAAITGKIDVRQGCKRGKATLKKAA